MTHVSIFMYEFDSFIEAIMAFRGWLHALPMIYQILVLIGLVALTVGVLSLVYYAVKGAIILCIEIVKATINIIKSIIEAITNHTKAPTRQSRRSRYEYRQPVPPVAPAAPTAPTAPLSPMPPRPLNVTTAVQVLHCPECGEQFTPEMMKLMANKHNVFCEFCGKELEFVQN